MNEGWPSSRRSTTRTDTRDFMASAHLLLPQSLSGSRFLVLASRFNEIVTERLAEGAVRAFAAAGFGEADVDLAWVPGAFELPVAAKAAAVSKVYAGVVAVGLVLRGQTAHFDYVAGECASGLARTALETGVPIGFGVLTADDLHQALDRAGGKLGNKGAESAQAVLETAGLLARLRQGGR